MGRCKGRRLLAAWSLRLCNVRRIHRDLNHFWMSDKVIWLSGISDGLRHNLSEIRLTSLVIVVDRKGKK
jgi:hypothetical protein